MNKALHWIAKLEYADRRWIFLFLAGAIIISLLTGVRYDDTPSDLVQPIYDHIETMPAGAPLLLSMDYSPSSAPELEPMAEALTRHALLSGHPVCYISLWPTGNNMAERVIRNVIGREFPEAQPGEDWALLGFQAGGEMLINSLLDSLQLRYKTDASGRALADMPLFENVVALEDFGLLVSLSAGIPGLKEWILYAGDTRALDLAGGCTGVGAPQFFPYYPQQIIGLMGALKGASEYEAALRRGYPAFKPVQQRATEAMGPQTAAHVVIVGFILLGNLGRLARKRSKAGGK
jgi:hypothetical protein